jgi:hypothetical protein
MTNMSWKMFLHLHFYINIDIMYCVYCYYLFAFVLFAYYCSSAVLSQTFCEQGIRHSAVLGMTRTTSVV